MVDDLIFICVGAPYIYKITSINKEYYYGIRWDYNGEPQDDFWKKYFTSSDTIHEIIKLRGKTYFTPEILFVFGDIPTAQNKEIELIKPSIGDPLCLNKACGKCAIWDDEMKTRMVKNLNKFYKENPKLKARFAMPGNKNPNYNLNPWRNVNGCKHSWKKAIQIYSDMLAENWDLSKRKYGRFMLMRRYKLAQGSARKMLDLFKKRWNPNCDGDYLKFFRSCGGTRYTQKS